MKKGHLQKDVAEFMPDGRRAVQTSLRELFVTRRGRRRKGITKPQGVNYGSNSALVFVRKSQHSYSSGKDSVSTGIFHSVISQARWLGRFAVKCLEIPVKYIPFPESPFPECLSPRRLFDNVKRLSPTVITPEIKKDQTIKPLEQFSLPPESRKEIFLDLASKLIYLNSRWAKSSEECNHQACTPASLGTHTFYPTNKTDEFQDLVKTLLLEKLNHPDLPAKLSGEEMRTLFVNALVLPGVEELFKRTEQLNDAGMLPTDALAVSINESIDALALLINNPDDSAKQALPSLPAESSAQGEHTQNRTQPVVQPRKE